MKSSAAYLIAGAVALLPLVTASVLSAEGYRHISFEIRNSSVVIDDQKPLVDDSEIQASLAELAKENPKSVIYLTSKPGIPFDRIGHVVKLLQDSGLKIMLVGHEAPG
jgi:biopolymer transport protein ExbD